MRLESVRRADEDDGDVAEDLDRFAVRTQAHLSAEDMALFDAKRQRGTYRFFTPQLHEQAVEKMQVVADLHRGLERGEFELYYQPIVAASGEVSGAEALLRWNHPQWGRQEPSRFIALAEEAGLIVPLGEWVIREACRRLGEMSGPGRPAPFVSVNLSMRQLQEPSLVPTIARGWRLRTRS